MASWKVRLLLDIGWLERPVVDLPPLPADAPQRAVRVYQGFGELLQVRTAYYNLPSVRRKHPALGPEPVPLSVRFCALWSGLSLSTADRGLAWLEGAGYLSKAGNLHVSGYPYGVGL